MRTPVVGVACFFIGFFVAVILLALEAGKDNSKTAVPVIPSSFVIESDDLTGESGSRAQFLVVRHKQSGQRFILVRSGHGVAILPLP